VAFLVFVAAPVSGTSLNPARSLGPAVASSVYRDLWVYLLAPPVGALAAVLVYRRVRGTVKCGKLFHSDAFVCRFLECGYTPEAARIPRSRSHGGERNDPCLTSSTSS